MKRKTILLLFCTLVQFLSAQTNLRCGTCAAPMPTAALTAHSRAQRAPSQTDLPTLDLLFVYDKTGGEYAAANGGEAAHAQRIIDLSNVVLNNSHIAAQFRLVGTLLLPDVVPSVQNGLTFVLSHEGVAAERRRVHADIVVLCSEPVNDGLSGVAPLEAKKSAAMASVRASAASDSYTVVHEIGHIFGCQHSREAMDAGTHPYAVGASRAPYYTVMGFPSQEGLVEQAPIFSSPNSVWKGVVMGSATEDCVRKINERLSEVLAFDQQDEGYQLSQTLWQPNHQAQELEVTLTTETFYFIHSDAEWLTCSAENGYGNRTLTLRVAENPNSTPRTATLTIDGSEEFPPATITVRQEGRTTAVQSISGEDFQLHTQPGTLHLTTTKATHLRIHDLRGHQLVDTPCGIGHHAFALPASGLYIVSLRTSKQVVRQWVRVP